MKKLEWIVALGICILSSTNLMGCKKEKESPYYWRIYSGNIPNYHVTVEEMRVAKETQTDSSYYKADLKGFNESIRPYRVIGEGYGYDKGWDRIYIAENPQDKINFMSFELGKPPKFEQTYPIDEKVKPFSLEQIEKARNLLREGMGVRKIENIAETNEKIGGLQNDK